MEPEKQQEAAAERTYAAYREEEHLVFDPLQDLNLPASYEEVQRRYKRLRTEREAPSLN